MFADTDLRVDLVQARIDIDKQRVADLGMSLSDISNQIGLLNSEAYVTRFDDRGRAYRVIPKVAKSERTSPDAILDLPIRPRTGGDSIPLGAARQHRASDGTPRAHAVPTERMRSRFMAG